MSYPDPGQHEVVEHQQPAAQPESRTRRSRRVSQPSARKPTSAPTATSSHARIDSVRTASPPLPAIAASSAAASRPSARQAKKRAASQSNIDSRPGGVKNAKAQKRPNVVLTKTGRLSKALKGVPVHECKLCGKVYSRNEHLRRHQRNHRTSPLQCKDCKRTFFREDLLSRHIAKYHNPNGESSNIASDAASLSQRSSAEPQSLSARVQRRVSIQNTEASPAGSSLDNVAIDGSHSNKQVTPLFPEPLKPTWPTEVALTQQTAWDASLIPASSAVAPTWLQPQPYCLPTVTPGFVEPTEAYALSNFEWSGLTSLQSPVSDSAPIWDQQYYLDPEMAAFGAVRSSPAPISAVPPLLMPVASQGQEEGLEDPQMGLMFSKDRQRTYVDAYWRCFHPKYPILHQRKFSSYKGLKGLLMAIMAVGAQYTQDMFAATDSRILLERCLDALCKSKHNASNMSLEFMQAIVLLEFLYHFKARRAPDGLSETFLAVYDKLWDIHTNQHSKEMLDALHVIKSNGSDARHQQWLQWIDVHSKERLLAACYVLDARHALLLGRRNHMSAVSGLQLFAPLTNVLWDMQDSSRWAQSVSGATFQNVYIVDQLDRMQNAEAGQSRCEIFPSLIIGACYAASATAQRTPNGFDFAQPTHLLFGACSHLLPGMLSTCSGVAIMILAVELINVIPFKALIATAGESWFFSKRLAGDAQTAAEEFARLKQEMRAWTSGTPQVPMFHGMGAAPSHATGSLTQAVSISLQIIKEAARSSFSHIILVFGPDMALYFSALVLWAATFASTPNTDFSPQHPHVEPQGHTTLEQAQGQLKAKVLQFVTMAPNHILAPVLRSQSSPSVLSLPQQFAAALPHHSSLPGTVVDMAASQFVPLTVAPSVTMVSAQNSMPMTGVPLTQSTSHASVIPYAGMTSTSIIRPDMINTWRSGVEEIFKWAACMLAAPAQQSSGAGELLEGAIGVLEKLGTDGWVGHWF